MSTIFRQVTFKCAGCGTKRSVAAEVPVHDARTPFALPEGWGTADVIGQHSATGILLLLAVPVCSEACGGVFMRAISPGAGEDVVLATPDVVAHVDRCLAVFDPGGPGVDGAPQGSRGVA